jgi:FtsP/CotA-like multicopper oxidase with cupredoxin domain
MNPKKHTIDVKPGEVVFVNVKTDSPGLWAFHCHVLYRMDTGMFRVVRVR